MPQSTRFAAAILPLVALSLTACSTLNRSTGVTTSASTTALSQPGEVETRPPPERRIRIGFTPEMVRAALGKPDDVRTRETARGKLLIWDYRQRSPNSDDSRRTAISGTVPAATRQNAVIVTFSKGQVSSVQKTINNR